MRCHHFSVLHICLLSVVALLGAEHACIVQPFSLQLCTLLGQCSSRYLQQRLVKSTDTGGGAQSILIQRLHYFYSQISESGALFCPFHILYFVQDWQQTSDFSWSLQCRGSRSEVSPDSFCVHLIFQIKLSLSPGGFQSEGALKDKTGSQLAVGHIQQNLHHKNMPNQLSAVHVCSATMDI